MGVSWVGIALCEVGRIWRFNLFVATILRVPPVYRIESRVSYHPFIFPLLSLARIISALGLRHRGGRGDSLRQRQRIRAFQESSGKLMVDFRWYEIAM